MAWIAPTTRSTGVKITSSIWNNDVVDTRALLHDPPAVVGYRTTNQTIIGGDNLDMDADEYDTDAMRSGNFGGAADRLRARTAGVYLIWGTVRWTAGAGSYALRVRFYHITTGTPIAANRTTTSAMQFDQSLATIYKMAQNDEVQFSLAEFSSGNLEIVSDSDATPKFGMHWLGSGE